PGRLPLGWSPVAAVDVDPVDLAFGQPVVLRLKNEFNLPARSAVTVAVYDPQGHQWAVVAPASADGAQITATLSTSGQLVLLTRDAAPFAPPAPVAGQALRGVPPVTLPANIMASGQVVPRSAPPGDQARADGTVVVTAPGGLPSGTAVQAEVTERYDLFDGSTITPTSFTQDLLLYTRPGSNNPSTLTATFPITPSLSFGLNELSLGKVRLDVVAPGAELGGIAVGAAGGTVTDRDGDAVELPVGSLTAETVLALRPLAGAQLPLAIPAGFELLHAVQFEVAGATLSQPATLSIPRPASLPDGAQVIIAQIVGDPAGIRRLRVVALGQVQASRVVSQTLVGSLGLHGITGGGQYVVVQATAAVGFITGVITAAQGGNPQALAVVTADTAPFADVTGTTGTYIIAGRAGGLTTVTAIHAVTRNTAAGGVSLTGPNEVATLDLTLTVVAPTVVVTTPVSGAVNVPVNNPISAQFSVPLDPPSVTASSVVLQLNGAPVAGQRVLAPDGRSVTFHPDAELQSKSVYTLRLGQGLRDLGGNPLASALAVTFTTVDTSKPAQPPAGQITAQLPDGDGLVMVFGTLGSAEAGSAGSARDLRTQETTTVLATTDGSFRLRIAALLGDELGLTLRNASGQDVTLGITRFQNPDGTT